MAGHEVGGLPGGNRGRGSQSFGILLGGDFCFSKVTVEWRGARESDSERASDGVI